MFSEYNTRNHSNISSKQNSNNLLNLQNNLLEVWTEKNVDNYYQTIYLSYLDSITDPQRLQKQVSKEIRLTYQGKSQFFVIHDLLVKRQEVFNNLLQQIQQVQDCIQNNIQNITESILQPICDGIDQLRRYNLLCGQAIVNFQTSLFTASSSNQINSGTSLAEIAKQLDLNHPMFGIMSDDADILKKSFMKYFIVFQNSYDPFLIHPYQLVLKNSHFPRKSSRQVRKLFMMNISYAYRLLKAQHQILKFMSQGNHKEADKQKQKRQILSSLGRENRPHIQKIYQMSKDIAHKQKHPNQDSMTEFLQMQNIRKQAQLSQLQERKNPQKMSKASKSPNSSSHIQKSPFKNKIQQNKLPQIITPKLYQKTKSSQKEKQYSNRVQKQLNPLVLGSQVYQIPAQRRQKSLPSRQKIQGLQRDNLRTPKRVQSRNRGGSLVGNFPESENRWNLIGLPQRASLNYDLTQQQQTERKKKLSMRPKHLKDNLSMQIKRNQHLLKSLNQQRHTGNLKKDTKYSLPMSYSPNNPNKIQNKRIYPNLHKDSNQIAEQLNESVSMRQSSEPQAYIERSQENYIQIPYLNRKTHNKKKLYKVVYVQKQQSSDQEHERVKNRGNQSSSQPKKKYLLINQSEQKSSPYKKNKPQSSYGHNKYQRKQSNSKLQSNFSPKDQERRIKQKYWNSPQHSPSHSNQNTELNLSNKQNQIHDYQSRKNRNGNIYQPQQKVRQPERFQKNQKRIGDKQKQESSGQQRQKGKYRTKNQQQKRENQTKNQQKRRYQHNQQKRRHQPRDQYKRSHQPNNQQKRKHYQLRDQQKRRYQPTDQQKRRHYQPRNQQKRRYQPTDQQERTYQPRDQQKKRYQSRDQQKRRYQPRDQQKRRYQPRDQYKKNSQINNQSRVDYPEYKNSINDSNNYPNYKNSTNESNNAHSNKNNQNRHDVNMKNKQQPTLKNRNQSPPKRQDDFSFSPNQINLRKQPQPSQHYQEHQGKTKDKTQGQMFDQQKPNYRQQTDIKRKAPSPRVQQGSSKHNEPKARASQVQNNFRNQMPKKSADMPINNKGIQKYQNPAASNQRQLISSQKTQQKPKNIIKHQKLPQDQQYNKNKQSKVQKEDSKRNQKQQQKHKQYIRQLDPSKKQVKPESNKQPQRSQFNKAIQSNAIANKSPTTSQISQKKNQLQNLNVTVKPGKIESTNLNQYLKNPKISAKYRNSFETDTQGKWIQIMKQHTTFLTEFWIGKQMGAFGLCQPVPPSNCLMIKYWGCISQICSQEKSQVLFKKYIDYLQKYSTVDNILYKGKPFDLLSVANFIEYKKQVYQKKRSNQSKKSKPQYQNFLSFEISNIKFSENKIQGDVQKQVSLYSEQIQAFSEQNSAGNKFLLQVDQSFIQMALKNQKIKGIEQTVKHFKKVKQIQAVNEILEDKQFDTYQVASDMKIQNVDFFMLKMNSSLKSNFCIQDHYIKAPSQINNHATCKDRQKFIYEVQFSNNKLKCYFASGKGYKSAQEFSKNIQRAVNQENNPKNSVKERIAIKMFSKQLYGQIKTENIEKFGLYGNWEINLLYEPQLHGRIKVSLDNSIKLGPQPFYMAIFIGDVYVAAIKVHQQDFIQ